MFHQAFYFYAESFDKYDSILQATAPVRHDLPVRKVPVGRGAAVCLSQSSQNQAVSDLLPHSLEEEPVIVTSACLSQTEKEQMLSGSRLTRYRLDLDDLGSERFAGDAASLFARLHSRVPVKMIPYLEHLHTRMFRVIEQIAPVTTEMDIDRELLYSKLQNGLFHPMLQSAGICRLVGRLSEHRLFYDPNTQVFGVADDGQIRFGSPYEDCGWFIYAWGLESSLAAFVQAYQLARNVTLTEESVRGFYALHLLQEVAGILATASGAKMPDAGHCWQELDETNRQHVWRLMERVAQVFALSGDRLDDAEEDPGEQEE